MYADAANPALLDHAGLDRARVLVIAFSDVPSTRHLVEYARANYPRLIVVVRTHGEDKWAYLRDHGVDLVVRGEREVAVEMSRFTLHRSGNGGAELQAIVQGIRHRDLPNELAVGSEPMRGPFEMR